MEANDPFGSIAQLCHVSSSQEERLRRCRFAGDPDQPLSSADNPTESPEIPVVSTGITLVSLPETSEVKGDDNNAPRDVFETPPEGPLDQTADGAPRGGEEDCADGAAEAVDLGRDTDLGFSEVELTQRIESEEAQSESEKVRVLKRESPLNHGINESPSKRWKISDQNSGLESPAEISRERLVKSMEKLKFKGASPYSYGAKSNQNHRGGDGGGENCEESLTKRRLDFSKEALFESRIEENNGVRNAETEGLQNTRSVEDIDKFRYVGPSVKAQAMRVLPVSIQGRVELDAEKDCREVTLLDVLRILAGECDYGCLKEVSVLDVAKSRGMTFPRPSWWPEEGFKVADD